MRIRLILLVAALGLAVLAGCGQSRSTKLPQRYPAGTITGLVQSFTSGHKNHLSPAAKIAVIAYRRAFPFIGPVLAHGPKPAARASTDAAGRYVLRGLSAGRYFIVADSTARWVTLPPGRHATTSFAICSDCPLPM